MITETIIQEGQILTGPQFNEPMLVETVRSNGPGTWVVGLVDQRSPRPAPEKENRLLNAMLLTLPR